MSHDDERTPPRRIRIGKLEEVQVADLVKVDRACAEMYWLLGFDAAEVPTRSSNEFYQLPRNHAVRVAEADYNVAGFVAWRDEAPGIAYVEDIGVHPDYQRFGVGRKLMERVFEEAREAGFTEIALRAWDKVDFVQAFYKKLGFSRFEPGSASNPEKLALWYEEKTAGDRPFLRPDESVLWRAVPAADEEED
ncbi:MAG: GNAT family N-acetyltransferase [Polyangiaceae bacterium]